MIVPKKILNNIGERTDPCLSPFVVTNGSADSPAVHEDRGTCSVTVVHSSDHWQCYDFRWEAKYVENFPEQLSVNIIVYMPSSDQ